ncbi:MAG: RNA 2',3'-cyclic phosphodiesterase [Candidatus Aenigmatarchaeota archaeon]
MRLFIAVKIPEDLKAKIASIQDRLDSTDDDIKLVEPENLHFNLKFIGEYELNSLPKLKAAMDSICSQFEAFDAHIADIGTFPSPTFIRTIWLGMKKGGQALSAIAESIEMGLESLGITKDERGFTPHLTLARVKGRCSPELISVIRELKGIDIGSFKVEEITLFESKLTPKGPIYSEIHSVKLR